ncbi:MAG: serine/threonine-protein phosphatase, partial [Pirellulales bacterium]|nr:serine/threonine-protein phosphatase [Pirellulales bacterium]
MYQSDPERMECMEVWGGNQAIQRKFQTPGLKIWVNSQPFGHAVAGGDIYYLSCCASGRITRMLLADVSGHGELVSRTAIGLRDLMRRNVNYIKQTRFVGAMNRQFTDLDEQGGFATALVSTFFASTMTYSLCNAGHPSPIV